MIKFEEFFASFELVLVLMLVLFCFVLFFPCFVLFCFVFSLFFSHLLGRAYFKKLDSSLKKNSAFTKRVSSLSSDNEELLMNEIKTLNLSKYIDEIVKGIINAPLRNSAIGTAVRVFRNYFKLNSRFVQS